MKEINLKESLKADIARERFWRYLVDGYRDPSDSDIQRRLGQLGITHTSPLYAVAEVSLHIDMYCPDDVDAAQMAMEETLAASLEKKGFQVYSYIDSRNCLIVILGSDNPDRFAELDALLARQIHRLMAEYEIVIYAGIGGVVNSLSRLSESAKEADLCIAYKYAVARDHVIHIKNVRKILTTNPMENSTAFERVIGCFLDGNLDRLGVRMEELLEQLSAAGAKMQSVRQMYLELFAQVMRHAADAGVRFEEEETGEYLQHVLRETDMQQLRVWFVGRCAAFIEQMNARRQENTSSIADTAKKYVERNYADQQLTQQSVSDYLSLSVGYFGQLFYAQTGQRFIDYLHEYRLELARTRLETTNDKVKDISMAVGFSSANYFNALFKKKFNLTPKEYRLRMQS